MSESIEFIKDRTVKTISAAKSLEALWLWQEKTIGQMEEKLVAIVGNKEVNPPVIGQEELASRAESFMLMERGTWDTNLDILHRRTVQGVAMAKNRHRDNSVNIVVLNGLTADSNSRTETLEQALAWESAWIQLEADWCPMPANTLSAFKNLRKECTEDLKQRYSDARTKWRCEVEKLAKMSREMEDWNVAWYADATRAFPEGTPEGDMIRSTIPTTYSPSNNPPASPTPPPTPPPR